MNTRIGFLSLVLGAIVALCSSSTLAQSWSSTSDFEEGVFLNLNATTVSDQLQINTWVETKDSDPPVLPYLWVACSERGTVVRIATSTFDPLTGNTVEVGDILGEYRTAPDGCGGVSPGFGTDPSRTTVDFDGSVWVANRNDITYGLGICVFETCVQCAMTER